jgi:hypothetical protein
MTRKTYKSAMGKTVDLGALLLQNEQVRAVGNMGVNAAGDMIDSTNRVIDRRNLQVQRQYKKQTNVGNSPVSTSNLSARKIHSDTQPESVELDMDVASNTTVDNPVSAPDPVADDLAVPTSGGLAAAIARSREVKQELEKTLKQRAREQSVRKI